MGFKRPYKFALFSNVMVNVVADVITLQNVATLKKNAATLNFN